MDDISAKILSWLDQQSEAMIGFLEQLVNIDSNSYDKVGVDRVGSALGSFFETHDIASQTYPLSVSGDIVVASLRPSEDHGNYLLMGHRDTVFPKGEVEKRRFSRQGDRAFGPGVADMKAGLVMNAFIMAAFRKFAPHIPLVMLATSDEEIGSPQSRPFIVNEAKRAIAVFNSEPARLSGNIVTARKGGMTYRFNITGKAAHSGVNYSDGINAVEEFAHKLIALHKLTNVEQGYTVSVNLVEGGQSSNTIAPFCQAQADVRFVTLEQRAFLMEKIEAIFAHSFVAGTVTEFSKNAGFLPLNPETKDKALAENYFSAARMLGFSIAGEYTGGSADSGLAASVGAPTICGVGPVGGKAHTVDEFVELHTLSQRAKVLALTILNLHAQKQP